jgi:HD-GYP domain-containing protein (c-di-GMP phosphodiesterase class II)
MDLLDRLVGEARDREPQPMSARERVVAGVAALTFLCAASALAALLPSDGSSDPLTAAGLVVMFAAVWRVRFEIGTITAGAEQLVFVPMLFLVPVEVVPLLVACGYLLGRIPDFVRRQMHVDRWLHAFGDAWFSIGPVLVIGLLAPGDPSLGLIEVYVVALIAQVAAGVTYSMVMDMLLYELSPLEALRQELFAYRIDVVLSPVAFTIASVAVEEPLAALTVFPLVWLLSVFSQERRQRYAAALELNRAYRGTVMVLADVVETEDHYTASHSRSVVELAVAVADELGIDDDSRQELEIAALLHDVGKIAIPKEILTKPAALTDQEFEIMKTHTVEGQALLDRVGGLLGRVGEIVRSCHERWDGAGYPDGLISEEIPLAARVVFCCDAFSAMTTDRPYRKALSQETALEEIRRNAATQFDPRVAEAVCKVVSGGQVQAGESYTDAVRAVLAGHSLPATELKASV